MTTTKPAVELLHRLLYRALIEMREQGRESGNKVVFHLADLFHTTALELGRVAEGQSSYQSVLRNLEEKAAEKGIEQRLRAAIAEIEDAQSVRPAE
ncbi:MAG: hypothetical protein L0241_05795 [Planctomycetia bacterium]|nr:hypothetical protein [Planctomycetia bacterium]